MQRKILQVTTPTTTPFDPTGASTIDVKVGYLGNEVVSIKPEFDHCKKISLATGVALKRISDLAITEAWKSLAPTDNI